MNKLMIWRVAAEGGVKILASFEVRGDIPLDVLLAVCEVVNETLPTGQFAALSIMEVSNGSKE